MGGFLAGVVLTLFVQFVARRLGLVAKIKAKLIELRAKLAGKIAP